MHESSLSQYIGFLHVVSLSRKCIEGESHFSGQMVRGARARDFYERRKFENGISKVVFYRF